MAGPKRLSSAGAKIVGGLTEFRDALKEGAKIDERFTVRTVELDLHPHSYGADDVKGIRNLLGLSQALFAKFLGVDLGTVRSWEQGKNPPSPMACRFMDEIRNSPDHWKGRLNQAIKTKSRPKVVS